MNSRWMKYQLNMNLKANSKNAFFKDYLEGFSSYNVTKISSIFYQYNTLRILLVEPLKQTTNDAVVTVT